MIATVLNYLIGVVGIVLTIYYALKFSEKKDPRLFTLYNLKIARGSDAQEIAIAYRGQSVARVASTLIWFWNAGRRPIRSDDVPSSHPVTFTLKDDDPLTILDIALVQVSRPSINLSVAKRDDSTLTVAFDFLDQSDGCLLDVQHTGGAQTVVTADGVILGAPKGIRYLEPGPRFVPRFHGDILYQVRHPWRHRAKALAPPILVLLMVAFMVFWLFKLERDVPVRRSEMTEKLRPFVAPARLDSAVSAAIIPPPGPSMRWMARLGAGLLLVGGVGMFVSELRDNTRPSSVPRSLIPTNRARVGAAPT